MQTLSLATHLEPYSRALELIEWRNGRVAGILYIRRMLSRKQRADIATLSVLCNFRVTFA